MRESVSVTEAAKVLGCSGETVRRLYKLGELEGFAVGKADSKRPVYRIFTDSITAYLERQTQKVAAPKEKPPPKPKFYRGGHRASKAAGERLKELFEFTQQLKEEDRLKAERKAERERRKAERDSER